MFASSSTENPVSAPVDSVAHRGGVTAAVHVAS